MTAENDAPVVWHDEAQRFNDLGLLDPPAFCACERLCRGGLLRGIVPAQEG